MRAQPRLRDGRHRPPPLRPALRLGRRLGGGGPAPRGPLVRPVGHLGQPRRGPVADYIRYDEMCDYMSRAVAVVCHGGPATIMDARKLGRVPIVVPRNADLGEHVDNHQQRFAKRMAELGEIHLARARTRCSSWSRRPSPTRRPSPPRPTARAIAAAVAKFEELVDGLFDRKRAPQASGPRPEGPLHRRLRPQREHAGRAHPRPAARLLLRRRDRLPLAAGPDRRPAVRLRHPRPRVRLLEPGRQDRLRRVGPDRRPRDAGPPEAGRPQPLHPVDGRPPSSGPAPRPTSTATPTSCPSSTGPSARWPAPGS